MRLPGRPRRDEISPAPSLVLFSSLPFEQGAWTTHSLRDPQTVTVHLLVLQMQLLLRVQLEDSTDSLMLVVQSVSSLDELLFDLLEVLVEVRFDDVVVGGHLIEIDGLLDEVLKTD